MKFKAVLILLSISSFVFSQTKNEKEERISESDFPTKALEVVKHLPEKCKRLKFYKETDGDTYSFEVKFKYKGNRYSLEFYNDGRIEDIEVLTKFKNLKDNVRGDISNYFKASFSKYRFIKVQEQFVKPSELEDTTFVNDVLDNTSKVSPNFEIIAEVKSDTNHDIREFTFNHSGEIVDFRILNPASYEHVLY